MIQLLAAGFGLFKQYKVGIYALLIVSACGVCFFAGIGFSKNAADLKVANEKLKTSNMAMMHKAQLDLIAEVNRIAYDEKQAQINFLQEEFAIADKNYMEKMQNVQKENDRLNECFKSGKCVQRAKIKAPVCANAGREGVDQQGSNEAVYAELDNEVAAGTRRVTEEGDRIISECNQLKDKVEACVNRGLCWLKFI